MSATADLTTIRTKVRNVTAMQSVSEITDAEIDSYINTYYIYDFPFLYHLYIDQYIKYLPFPVHHL